LEDHGFGSTGFSPSSYKLYDQNENPIKPRRTLKEGAHNALMRFTSREDRKHPNQSSGTTGMPTSRKLGMWGLAVAGASMVVDPNSALMGGSGRTVGQVMTSLEGGASSSAEHLLSHGEAVGTTAGLAIAGIALAYDAVRNRHSGAGIFVTETAKGLWNTPVRRGIGKVAMGSVRGGARLVRKVLP
jgi:hypothetical protein